MYAHWFIIIHLIVGVAISKSKSVSEVMARDRLLNHLFVNYDPHARPAPKGQVIDLQISLEMQHFDYRESDGAFNFAGVLNVLWKDPKLSWNPSIYNNISRLTVDQHVIWVPDVEIYNNVPDKFLHMHRKGLIFLEHTGGVRYSDTVGIVIFCTAIMKNWPYDEHKCQLQLGSWMYDGLDVDMNVTEPKTSIYFDETPIYNTEYKLMNFSALHILTKYECCTEPYVSINYTIQFKRRAAFVTIFHSLAACIVILNLLALTLPPGLTLKLWLNSGSLMLVIANLLYFAGKVGKFARETPLIVTFHCIALLMITGAFLLTVFSIFATRSGFGRGKLPIWITNLFRNSINNYIIPRSFRSSHKDCQSSSKFVDIKLNDDESNLLSSASDIEDWLIFARLVERVVLMVYMITYFIAGAICFL